MERSEIIKAQSVTLGKLVTGALRAQASVPKTSAGEDAHDEEGGDNNKQTRDTSALDKDEVLRRYQLVLAGNPEPLPLSQIFGNTPFAAFATHESQPSGSPQSSPIDIGAMIKLQTAPSSELLMRDPDALKALLDFAVDSPLHGDTSDSGGIIGELPPNHELLAMIEQAEEELLSSEDEDHDDSLIPEDSETAQSAEDDPLEEFANSAAADSVSLTLTAETNAAHLLAQQPPELVSRAAVESGVVPSSNNANADETNRFAHTHRAEVVGTPAAPLPVNVALLSESLTAAVSTTVTKPRRAKKSPPVQSKYGRLLVDLRKPAPDIGPPPKNSRKVHAPRNPSDLSATMATPWSKRQQTQTLCAFTESPLLHFRENMGT